MSTSSQVVEGMLHTPGPWRVEAAGDGFRKPTEDGAKDFQIVAANGICPGIVWDYLREGEANARLFAAAPELLAALKDICEWLEAAPGGLGNAPRASLDTAYAVIAKAEVRSNG